ncbi:MAG: tRNA (adenosine(37)-N6)-threonylcarbamoyltransferase complex transferase subunit TsaD [Deltaproteobacteria bacterium]|nr:tRNA (adenosine(37)-N6)-threonylcarbamoyltransferase complex transferase subunit TsaD [Deltaproteobacteria bacterium]
MIFFGLETSCDETSWCLAEFNKTGHQCLHLTTCTQQVHEKYGGVVPEVSSRQHIEKFQSHFDEISDLVSKCDVIAVTEGPGLKGALLVGVNFASALSISQNKPCIPVDHIEAHLLSPMINSELNPPFISVVLSGGHTAIFFVEENLNLRLLSKTLDDAIGEAFDKIGLLLGCGYPYGRNLAVMADSFDGEILDLPIPLKGDVNFSFSGFKTAVKRLVSELQFLSDFHKHQIAASVQNALIETVLEKLRLIFKTFGEFPVGFSGGVSSNNFLRKKLTSEFPHSKIFFPPESLCLDNAFITCFAAFKKLKRGKVEIRLPKVYSRWKVATNH